MAGRNFTPVSFGLEKNIVQIYARVVFGQNGVPLLDTTNSKGFCNVAISAPVFSGTTSSGSSTITSVSSFAGLFTGMTLSGGGANGTIGTMTALTSSVVMTSPATSAGTSSISATGGQYIFQLGTQAGTRLDAYAKVLDVGVSFDESTGSASGGYQVLQTYPAAGDFCIVANNTKTRTIPATATSNSTDCTLTLQFGNVVPGGLVVATPFNGEVLRVNVNLGNSTSI